METFSYVDGSRIWILLTLLNPPLFLTIQVVRFGQEQPALLTGIELALIATFLWLTWIGWHRRHEIEIDDEALRFRDSPLPPPWNWLQKRCGISSEPPISWCDVTSAEIETGVVDRRVRETVVFDTAAGPRRVACRVEGIMRVEPRDDFLRAIRRRVPLG